MNETPDNLKLSPTQLIDVLNDTLGYTYDNITLEGEISSFKINQGKWVFFDIKDEESSINCFMTISQLRMPIEDGMKVIVRGNPKITRWGKFSFTVRAVQPVGEGNLKKSFELLKAKLQKEGLFDPAKKRGIPENLSRIGVISSIQAAGYADFIKIINARWGGLKIQTIHTQVQGLDAADQIIAALQKFNERGEVEIIAILRGGGSADDLAVFNDETLTRAIAASKIPVITGIGHEIDESLADLAADVRASTPSNAAEMLSKDRKTEIMRTRSLVENARRGYIAKIDSIIKNIEHKIKIIEALNPEKVLRQGYAILSGEMSVGKIVKITTQNAEIDAEIKSIKEHLDGK